jgi:hypothetical protein
LEDIVVRIVGALLALLCSVPACLGDEVFLKNGDRLTGTIEQSDGKTLTLHTSYAEDVSIKWDVVQGIESQQTLHLQLQDGKTVAGPVTRSDGKLLVSTSSGNVEAPIAEVKTLRSDTEEASYQKQLHPVISGVEDWIKPWICFDARK